MNIRATIAATLVAALLPIGLLAAPAYAADPETPPECDEAVQEWRDKAALLSYALQAQGVEVGRLNAENERLRSNLESQRQQATTAYALAGRADRRADRLHVRVVKMQGVMTRLRAEVRRLRR